MPKKKDPITDETMHVKSDLKILAEMRAFLRRVFTGIAEDPVERMELAANEVMANIVTHAYNGRPHHFITIRVTIFPHEICVDFTDTGTSFIPQSIALPIFDGSQEGGYGLFIVSQVVDQFTYCPTIDENRTHLSISLS